MSGDAAIVPGNRFYAAKINAAGIQPRFDSLASFFNEFPFTVRKEIIADQQEFFPDGSNLTFPIENYTRISLTSGTSGEPIRWLDTRESWDWMLGNKAKVFEMAGLAPGSRILFPFSFGPNLGFWIAFEAALKMGYLAFPGGGISSQARLQAIVNNKITALCCTPTYAVRLGEIARVEKVDFQAINIKAIFVGGEPGGSNPEIYSRIESLWPGARVFDHHGMTEVGTITYPCPVERNILHIIESGYIPEIIDPQSGRPVKKGAVGELVLTNLGRVGSPLLRYRTGDLVKEISPTPCSCGSFDMGLAGGIIGRLDDMIIVRGVNVYPMTFQDILQQFPEVTEYRVQIEKIRSMYEIRLTAECATDEPCNGLLREQLQNKVKTALGLRIAVDIVPAGSLPRFEMKAKRWHIKKD